MKIDSILDITIHQLNNNFYLLQEEIEIILSSSKEYFEKTIICLANSKNKYYSKVMEEGINPFHSNSYCVFLYWMSKYFSEKGNAVIADKIYYLNKQLNSVDLYHEIQLPEIWLVEHPLGSVIGRGAFGNKFFFMQGCGIGNNHGIYPTIGSNVVMFPNSKVIGDSCIGDNVVISASTFVKDQNVPDDVIVFGQSPDLVFKPNNQQTSFWK